MAAILVILGIPIAFWLVFYSVNGLARLIFAPHSLPKWARDESPTEVSNAFPVILPATDPIDEAGTYRVIGVDRETSSDIELKIPAATLANAKVKAELKGVIVTRIELLQPANPLDGVPQA